MLPKFLRQKKSIFIVLAVLILFSLATKPLLAFSSSTYRGGYLLNYETAVFKNPEMNLQSFVSETMKATGMSLFTNIVGCVSCNEEERKQNPGFLLTMGGFASGIYNSPPASSRRGCSAPRASAGT